MSVGHLQEMSIVMFQVVPVADPVVPALMEEEMADDQVRAEKGGRELGVVVAEGSVLPKMVDPRRHRRSLTLRWRNTLGRRRMELLLRLLLLRPPLLETILI